MCCKHCFCTHMQTDWGGPEGEQTVSSSIPDKVTDQQGRRTLFLHHDCMVLSNKPLSLTWCWKVSRVHKKSRFCHREVWPSMKFKSIQLCLHNFCYNQDSIFIHPQQPTLENCILRRRKVEQDQTHKGEPPAAVGHLGKGWGEGGKNMTYYYITWLLWIT